MHSSGCCNPPCSCPQLLLHSQPSVSFLRHSSLSSLGAWELLLLRHWPHYYDVYIFSYSFIQRRQTPAFKLFKHDHIVDFPPLLQQSCRPLWTQSVKCGDKEQTSGQKLGFKKKSFYPLWPPLLDPVIMHRKSLSPHFQVAAAGRTPALPLVPFDPRDWPERLRRSRSAFSLCACSSSYLLTHTEE